MLMRGMRAPVMTGGVVAVIAAAALTWGITATRAVDGVAASASTAVSGSTAASSPTAPSTPADAQRMPESPVDPSQVLRIANPYLVAQERSPTTSAGWSSGLAWRQVFRTLTRYEPGSADLQPDLATSWSSESGGRSWIFHLAAGRTFHDGSPVDADAVCANVDAWAADDDHLGWTYYFPPEAYLRCDAEDDVVTVRFDGAVSNLPHLLSEVSFSIAAPESIGTDQPIGSGPYRFEAVENRTVRLRAVDPTAAGPDAIEMVEADSVAAAAADLRAGRVDAVVGAAGDELVAGDGVRRIVLPDQALVSVQLFAGGSRLRDPQVRRGLVAALDPAALSDVMGADVGSALAPTVLRLGPYDRSVGGPGVAKKLLQGKKVDDLVIGVEESGSWDLAQARLLQRQFAAAGVSSSISTAADADEYYDAMRAGKYDVTVESLSVDNLDPAEYIAHFDPTGTHRRLLPASSRSDIERSMGLTFGTEHPQSRRASATALLEDLVRESVVVPIAGAPEAEWVGPRVRSWPTGPLGIIDLSQVRLG